MPRAGHPKGDTFNFRIDPALKAAFTQAAESEDRPAAQLLRDFMRAYVERQKRKAFEGEARRQSLAVAKRARNPESDEAKSLKELDTLFNEEQLRDEWKA
ncbi:CopG family ribbon-helix-helix protein [Rhizobium mongolense]|uniref:CopG family ribbon-helix-helix protein n=1 Tax=Rhizobium mongolense TaxID=57676 RepID=UPI0035567A8B